MSSASPPYSAAPGPHSTQPQHEQAGGMGQTAFSAGPSHTEQADGMGQTAGQGNPRAPDTTSLIDGDPTRPGDKGLPVYGPLSVAASKYQYTQQGQIRTLSVEYRNSSRLAEMCGRPIHRFLVRGWDELFWIISLPILLVTTFLHSAIRFLLEAVVRPVVLGPLQLLGDHLLKPLSVVQYDALLLPTTTLLANSLTALKLVMHPLGQLLDTLVNLLATLLSSIRLVHISYVSAPQGKAAEAHVV